MEKESRANKILVTVIAVVIVAGSLGFVGYHNFFVRGKVERPADIRASMAGFDREDIRDSDEVCESLKKRDGKITNIGGRDSGDRIDKMEEFCVDGTIDETERAELEEMAPNFQGLHR